MTEETWSQRPQDPVNEGQPQPVAEEQAVPIVESEEPEDDWDDEIPITKEDWINWGKSLFSEVVTGIKRPVRRAGRVVMTRAEEATDHLVGAPGNKKRKD